MRRVLVTGSRKWTDKVAIWNALNGELLHFPGGLVVIHGGAAGADTIADRWAWSMRIAGWPVEPDKHAVTPEEWAELGNWAGNARNQRMVDRGADVCHAFPLEGGAGTRHCMSRCFVARIPIINHGYQPHTEQARDFALAYG